MIYSDQKALMQKLQTQLSATIEAHFKDSKEEGARVRERVKKARGKGKCPKPGEGWVENYNIQVKHEGVYDGWNAIISVEGAARYYRVAQYDRLVPRPGYKLPTPTWNMYLCGDTKVAGTNQFIERYSDFEAAVQQCIVSLLGHVYYDL